MLDALDTDRLQALGDDPAAQYARTVIAQFGAQIAHQRAELKFQSTKIAALSFELARLKQWRFGQLRIPVNVTADSGNVTGIAVNVTEGRYCAF